MLGIEEEEEEVESETSTQDQQDSRGYIYVEGDDTSESYSSEVGSIA